MQPIDRNWSAEMIKIEEMEIGIDSFVALSDSQKEGAKVMRELLERIALADHKKLMQAIELM